MSGGNILEYFDCMIYFTWVFVRARFNILPSYTGDMEITAASHVTMRPPILVLF